jgi:tetratricopeptide (TPR) repeat protein
LSLRDTSVASWWHCLAILGSLFAADFVVNLLPIGYSDGTMLWHLVLWTEQGKQLYSKFNTSTLEDDAGLERHKFNFAVEAELRRNALAQVIARGNRASPDLARAYQALGWAQALLYDYAEAERNLKNSIEVLASCQDVEPALEADTWQKMYMVLRERFQTGEAERAYDQAVLAFERWRSAEWSAPSRAEITMVLAQVHLFQRKYPLAMAEIDAAIRLLPGAPKYHILRGTLFMFRASCEFGQGHPRLGQGAAETAERFFRYDGIPEAERMLAVERLAALGGTLANAGRSIRGAALMLESAGWFEERGIETHGATLRISAAAVLRLAERAAEAETALHHEASVAEWDLSNFLAERAEIRLAMGRLPEAIESFEAALRVAKTTSQVALRQEVLADAYFAAGRIEEAGILARTAYDSLAGEHNPEGAGAFLTLALVAWHNRDNAGARGHFDQALSMIESTPYLQGGIKARCLEQIAIRLERSSHLPEAREARDAAQLHWSFLGVAEPACDRSQEQRIVCQESLS